MSWVPATRASKRNLFRGTKPILGPQSCKIILKEIKIEANESAPNFNKKCSFIDHMKHVKTYRYSSNVTISPFLDFYMFIVKSYQGRN